MPDRVEQEHVVVEGDTVYVQCTKTQWLHVLTLMGAVNYNNCTTSLYMTSPEHMKDEARLLSKTLSGRKSSNGVVLTFAGDVI